MEGIVRVNLWALEKKTVIAWSLCALTKDKLWHTNQISVLRSSAIPTKMPSSALVGSKCLPLFLNIYQSTPNLDHSAYRILLV